MEDDIGSNTISTTTELANGPSIPQMHLTPFQSEHSVVPEGLGDELGFGINNVTPDYSPLAGFDGRVNVPHTFRGGVQSTLINLAESFEPTGITLFYSYVISFL